MQLSKFSWCNRLTLGHLAGLVRQPSLQAMPAYVDLRCAEGLNIKMMGTVLGLPDTAVAFPCCVEVRHQFLLLAATELRFCEICLANGFHAALFQWSFLKSCPIHRCPLRTGCPACDAEIPYRLDCHLAQSPLRCTSCGMSWVPCLDRPAGKCSSIESVHCDLVLRWTHYVEQIIGPAGEQATTSTDHLTGQFSKKCEQARKAQVVQRFEFVSTLNQLYCEPPPRHADFFSVCPATEKHLVLLSTKKRRRQAPLRPTQLWPHFNNRFIVMECILSCEKDHRLSQIALVSGTGDFGFNAQCIATQSALRPTDVATLGWCMSWYGFMHPRSVSQVPEHPAFGLACWLAGTPVRPSKTRDDMWFLHLQDLLRLDLAASWNSWLQIADFMHDHEVYFLHPALSKTADFAAGLHYSKEISSNR
jgi:hypothetical protein